ncbi:putative transposase [Oscillibacter valericigenes Sjm18-20]|nr:putative transposase [Oscillibacter valericigenes Sjm18-20]
MKSRHTILKGDSKPCPKIVQFNEEVIKGQIKELVRGSVEETLNGLLEAEAETLTQAAKYERSEERQGYRSDITAGISPRRPVTSRSMYPALRESHLKQRSLNDIATGRAA